MARVLSIEIGYSNIKIAEMDYQTKKPKVYKCIEVNTPDGAVKDGYIVAEFMEDLRRVIKEGLLENRIRTKKVLFTVFSTRIVTREIMVPGVKIHQIKTLIESNIGEYFPIDLDNYKVSHFLLDTITEGENAGKHKVLAIAVEKMLLNCYDELATELGLLLVDVDYMGNSLLQALKTTNNKDTAVMAVKMETDYAIISILKNNKLAMQRTVNYGMGLGRRTDALLTREERLESLLNTMMRVLEFYSSNNEESTVEKVYLLGDGPKDQRNMDYITSNMHVLCRNVEYMRNVTLDKSLDDSILNTYAALIGAGISSIGFANEKLKESKKVDYVNASALALVLFVVAGIGMFLMGLLPYNSAVSKQKDLKAKEEKYAPAKVVYDKYMSMTDLLAQVKYGNELTENSNDAILNFLTELEEKLPKNVEMLEFASDAETCVMTIRVEDKETAAGVIKNIREFESLMHVVVESIEEEVPNDGNTSKLESQINEEGKTVKFTLTAAYYPMVLEEPEIKSLQENVADASATESAQ